MIRLLLLSVLLATSLSISAEQLTSQQSTLKASKFAGFAALPTVASIRAQSRMHSFPQRKFQPRHQFKARPAFKYKRASFIRNRPSTAPKVSPKRQPKSNNSSDRAAFLSMLEPIIIAENKRLIKLREEVKSINRHAGHFTLSEHQKTRLLELSKRYRVKGNPIDNKQVRLILLEHIDVIPVSLALAQAVNESAWGTSRFAREGNNLFGIWTYDKAKGIVPKGRAAGKTHLVRIFSNYASSVRYYLHTLNSHPAYKSLRDTRATLRSQGRAIEGAKLANGLVKYSAKGHEYVSLIKQIIDRYNLSELDSSRTRA